MKKVISISLYISLCLLPLLAAKKINDIKVPEGYKRIIFSQSNYCSYIQNLPLKHNNRIYKWNGKRIWYASLIYNVLAVIDKPILFDEDLEQCADYSMRFWADYHKENNILDKLYLFDYNGNKKYFKDSNKSFMKYLRWHMAFSNSYSIKVGGRSINIYEKLVPGDMFVQNLDGKVGHVSVVVDAAENSDGDRIYLIGYSYIPAQEFHIEDAANQDSVGAWFTKKGYLKYLSDSRIKQPNVHLVD